MKVFRLSGHPDYPMYLEKQSDILDMIPIYVENCIPDDFNPDDFEIDIPIVTISVVEMPEDEFRNLPEWDV
jgi:hypothetical protein